LANIEKRGDTYCITVSNGYDITGKKIREKATYIPDSNLSPKQQQKAFDKFVFEFEEKVKNGKYLKGEKISLKDFSEKWMKDYCISNLQLTTYSSYQQYLDQKILPALGHLKLSKIQPMHLQSFYNNLLEGGIRKDGKEGGYSSSTIKKCHAILSSILTVAVHWQVTESNPCERVSPPKSKNIEDDIKYFTLEQAEAFLNAIEMEFSTTYKAHNRIDDTGKQYYVEAYTEARGLPTQLKIFFYLALFGGLRRGELIALTWNDVDYDNNTISVTKSTGYANKTTITKAPKNKSSIRTVKIPKSTMELLKKYKKEQNELRLSLGDQWMGDNNIFIQWNGKQMNLSTPYQAFKEIINKYNSTIADKSLHLPNIPLHGLRHTSATLLISENMDVQTVSSRLGHAQTSTTLNIYAHSLKKSDEKAACILENLFNRNACV
jgi:integrase